MAMGVPDTIERLPRVMNVEQVGLLVSAVFCFGNCHEFQQDGQTSFTR